MYEAWTVSVLFKRALEDTPIDFMAKTKSLFDYPCYPLFHFGIIPSKGITEAGVKKNNAKQAGNEQVLTRRIVLSKLSKQLTFIRDQS